MARAGLSHFSSNFSYRVYTRLDLLHLPPNRVSMYLFYVRFVRESEQIEKVSIDFHVFDVVKAL